MQQRYGEQFISIQMKRLVFLLAKLQQKRNLCGETVQRALDSLSKDSNLRLILTSLLLDLQEKSPEIHQQTIARQSIVNQIEQAQGMNFYERKTQKQLAHGRGELFGNVQEIVFGQICIGM